MVNIVSNSSLTEYKYRFGSYSDDFSFPETNGWSSVASPIKKIKTKNGMNKWIYTLYNMQNKMSNVGLASIEPLSELIIHIFTVLKGNSKDHHSSH